MHNEPDIHKQKPKSESDNKMLYTCKYFKTKKLRSNMSPDTSHLSDKLKS